MVDPSPVVREKRCKTGREIGDSATKFIFAFRIGRYLSLALALPAPSSFSLLFPQSTFGSITNPSIRSGSHLDPLHVTKDKDVSENSKQRERGDEGQRANE